MTNTTVKTRRCSPQPRRSPASSMARWPPSRPGRAQPPPPPACASRTRCWRWATGTAPCGCWTTRATRWGSGCSAGSGRGPIRLVQRAPPPPSRVCRRRRRLRRLNRSSSNQPNRPTQVMLFKEHKREVTDLSFDDNAEFLASGAADGSLAVRSLCWTALAFERRCSGLARRPLQPIEAASAAVCAPVVPPHNRCTACTQKRCSASRRPTPSP